jgi:hypothetical protein
VNVMLAPGRIEVELALMAVAVAAVVIVKARAALVLEVKLWSLGAKLAVSECGPPGNWIG